MVVELLFLDRKPQIYVLIEHKSSPELETFAKIGFYILSIFEEDLKNERKSIPVFPLVYYHGKASWGIPTRFSELFELPEELQPLFF